jgi:CTP:molybdopterin cytidylyltransferase MocA
METERRCDWAVLMARGDSRRMGQPKGLCRLPGVERTFLEVITGLYRDAGHPVAVVTTDDLAAQYRRCCPELWVDAWLLRTRGGGTAETVMAALADLADRATHLWLHPVDLPGVAADSLAAIRCCSQAHPGAVIVPEFQGIPGHPVVLPTGPFEFLIGWPIPTAQMRPWLLELTAPGPKRVAPLQTISLEDVGVVTDYDDDPAGRLTR